MIKLKTSDKNTPIRLKTIKRESNDSKKYKPTQKTNA